MIKLQLIYLTLCSLTQAAYYSRMAAVNRVRAPTAFRPGVNLHRPTWNHQRLMPAASHRVPYVVYRNPPHRYAMKHYAPGSTRNVYQYWKSPAPARPTTPGYEFVRSASAPPAVHNDGGTGAIHTIPAPNLSLSEKPIVVVDSENFVKTHEVTHKPTYEVTEKFMEPGVYQMSPKVEVPVGFSKPGTMTSPDVQNLIRNSAAALQFASDYGLSISLPPAPQVQQPQLVPQQFTMQSFNGIPTHQEFINSGADGIVIPPHTLYQADPSFLQKLQVQLMQRYPSVEFIPYAADAPTINIPHLHHQSIQQQHQHIQQQEPNHLFLLENEEITRQTPTSFEPHKNVVQRQTQESSVMSLIPHSFTTNNVSENEVEVTSASQPNNVTVELVTAESQPSTTTVKYIIESTTQAQNVTPIYYAQVGQSIGNIIANGFYSALNDIRGAQVLAQVEKPQDKDKAHEQEKSQEQENQTTTTTTTSTTNPELMTYFVQAPEGFKNHTEVKPHIGAPFTKTADSVNIAYTLLRANNNNKEPQVTKEGTVYAGQIVEATISEDKDFNKQKANLIQRRAPLRIISVTEKKDQVTSTSVPPKITVVKAKIPPKSKLIFDDKTGEPVLRIYASYVDSGIPKELLTTKLNNIKNVKEVVVKNPDGVENWTSAMVRKADKTQGHDSNQVTDFGVKLRSRSDDYIPLFEEYEE